MKNTHSKFILVIWFAIFQIIVSMNSAFAQSKLWTLEQCILYAHENNIQIKQQKLNVEFKQNNLNQSKGNRIPSLNAGADQNFSWGRTVDPYTNEFITSNVLSNNFYVNGSLTLFEGFKNKNTIEQYNFDLLASIQDVEKLRNDISVNIATAYLQVIYYEELVKINRLQLEITNQQLDRTQKLIDAGTLARGNLFDIQAQAANEELQIVTSENQVNSSYITLKQFLNLQKDSAFSIIHPTLPDLDTVFLTSSIDEIYNLALNLPEIKSVEYSLNSSEASLKIAQSGKYPKLSLNATFYTGYSDARKKYNFNSLQASQIGYLADATHQPVFADMPVYESKKYAFTSQLADNSSNSISLKLVIPIFNNYQVRSGISNSRINIENSQYKLQIQKDNLYKIIQQSYSDALAALAKYTSAKKALDANNEAFKYAQEKLNVGLISTFDYNNAKNKLAKANNELLQSKFEFLFKKSILDFYSGKSLKI